MSTLILIVLNVLCLPSIAEFRIFPEHIFTMDVGLICQVGLERLKLNAIISIWEEDVVSRDDFMDKLTIIDDNRFQYLFRHAEFGTVSPYMFIYHDCNPKVIRGQCYARTEFRFDEPKELGTTIFLEVDLLNLPTDIVCDKGYPFGKPPPVLDPFKRQLMFTNSKTAVSADPQLQTTLRK